jgi:crotonobetainyl-CoA:carnitine CoA-transferase CaiB-like acyl-CoA transferase
MGGDGTRGALAPYRVIDLTTDRGWMCGRVLTDLGADVVKVEPSGGDPGRQRGRFAGDTADPEANLTWWFQNRGKRSVVIDLDTDTGRDQLLGLVAGADVVVESFDPGTLEVRDLGPDELLARHPGLVVTSISAFGRTGPLAGHRASDLVLAGMAGMLWLTGDPDRPPVRISVPQLWRHAGVEAAVHTLVALHHAATSGHGQHVDVSAQLAGVRTLMNATAFPLLEGFNLRRMGGYATYSHARFRTVTPCSGGHVTVLPIGGRIGGAMMTHLFAWADREVGVPDRLRDADFTEIDFAALSSTPEGAAFFADVNDTIERLFARHTKDELYAAALEHGLLLAPVNTVADLRADEQLAARGYWEKVDHGDRGPVTYPGPWARLTATPLVETGAAPRIGQHTAEVLAEPARPPAAAAVTAAPPTTATGPTTASGPDEPHVPLTGLKVWDMSWVGVGPMTARYLADYGATVVRLDSSKRPDVLRLTPPFKDGEPGINRSHFYADFNCSKLGVGLDLDDERGREVARRLVAWADVLVESFTPKTMRSWGLHYEALKEINPSLVMLSTCMQGQTGPRANYRGFGNLMASLAGYYAITGWPDRGPVMVYGAYTDFICQRFCATVLLAALDHRRRTGQGQHIDVAQFEAALQFLGPELLDHDVNGRAALRMGNRDLDMAPHGVYPCRPEAGQDEAWVTVAVEDDDSWRALVDTMGRPAWADREDLATSAGRLAAADELDDHLAAWSRERTAAEVVATLQPAVAAGPVHDQSALYDDPQIAHRGYFQTLEHTVIGPVPYNGLQAILSRTPGRLSKAAPCVGEDSWTVLTEILGMDPDEVAALIAEDIVEMTG